MAQQKKPYFPYLSSYYIVHFKRFMEELPLIEIEKRLIVCFNQQPVVFLFLERTNATINSVKFLIMRIGCK